MNCARVSLFKPCYSRGMCIKQCWLLNVSFGTFLSKKIFVTVVFHLSLLVRPSHAISDLKIYDVDSEFSSFHFRWNWLNYYWIRQASRKVEELSRQSVQLRWCHEKANSVLYIVRKRRKESMIYVLGTFKDIYRTFLTSFSIESSISQISFFQSRAWHLKNRFSCRFQVWRILIQTT